MIIDLIRNVLALVRDAIEHRFWLREMPEITLDSDLEDLGFDPLDRACLACAIEEEYDIELPDSVISGWVTAGDVVACVEGIVA